MPKKNPDEYILGSEAAAIMTRNSGHTITQNYVRVLSGKKHGKIRSRMRDGRTREYHRGDVEAYRVEQKNQAPAKDEDHRPFAYAVAM